MKNTCVALLLLILSSCTYYSGVYDLSLNQVKSGTKNYPLTANTMTHSDSLIDITWKLNATSFSFQLVNKSNSNLRINWNEAVYVDHSGTSGAIIHSEVKYIDKNKPQKPTVIVAGSKVEDIIVPSENIYYVSGQYGGWKTKPILPNWGRSQEELDALTDVYIDKDISILLPISSGEDTYEYLFKFHVNDFKNTGKMSVY